MGDARVRPRLARAFVGAVCGSAWAGALRAYMVELAGPASSFDWTGTFFAILAPGALAGAALGAASAASLSNRTALRWAAASPLLFAAFTLVLPGQLAALLTTGIGGGAVGVPLAGIAGGYALRGARGWLRVVTGTVALAALIGFVATVPVVGGLPLTSPRGAWAGTLVAALAIVLMLGSSIPFARLGLTRATGRTARGADDADAARPPAVSR